MSTRKVRISLTPSIHYRLTRKKNPLEYMMIGDEMKFKDISKYNAMRVKACKYQKSILENGFNIQFKGSWKDDEKGGYGIIKRVQ